MSKSEFKDALDRTSEIELTVRGRKSGQDISRPVWFVHENNALYCCLSKVQIQTGTRMC